MPTSPQNGENPYYFDPEEAGEMARLMIQDRLVTKGMGGLFPERTDVSLITNVLDVGCGPGGWVLDVAFEYPQINVMGLDISEIMIQYARAQAWTQGLQNATFQVADALKPLDFDDHSFDLVNARTIIGFMSTSAWPRLVRECVRITQPGGVIRLTEGDNWGTTNSPALEQLIIWSMRAIHAAGHSFSPHGRDFGISPMLFRFLREAGCQNIGHRAHFIDLSAGTEAHWGWYQNLLAGFKLIQPFLIKSGITTQEEAEQTYQMMLAEMQMNDFCATWSYVTVWGETPLQ
jgi:ubiquinone/menaquinone biosynthesis C-methylase UbiE